MRPRLAALLVAALVSFPAGAQQQSQAERRAQQSQYFTIRNDGEVTLRELYVARGGRGARGWGQDRFGSDVVAPGESFRVRLPAGFGCVVDLRIVFEDGEEEMRERVDVCRTREVAFARALPAAAELEVAVENRTPRSLERLYISGLDETAWGEDRLGSATLAPGASITLRVPDQGCSYDIRAEFDNGGAEERRRVDLCAIGGLVIAPGWTTADAIAAPGRRAPSEALAGGGEAGAGEVAIVNRSGRTVFEVFVFPDGAGSRGPDRLGVDTLADGRTLRVPRASPPDCRQTLRLTYEDGQREERSGIDLCATAEIVVAPGWTGEDPAPQGQPQGQPEREVRSEAQPGVGTAAPGSSPGTVGIANRSSRVVFELYTFPDGARNEGPDRLGAEVMRPGGSVRVPAARPPACATTVRGGLRQRRAGGRGRGLISAACRNSSSSQGGPLPPSPERRGSSTREPCRSSPSFADPPGAPRGPDRLGGWGVIGVGEGFNLVPPENGVCAYDLIAVFRDRRSVRVAGADLCAGTELRIAP
jgi:hypothetical protein